MSKEISNSKIPNVLLIGAQKAGTTSLFDWIAQHPQVLTNPAVKDFPFFWYDSNYEKGIGELTKLFPERQGESVVLAGNVNDMFFEKSAERIKSLNPDMKLIICLRNPVERAFSAYNYALQRGFESRTFEMAIEQELSGEHPDDLVNIIQKEYIEHGLYWKQIRHILESFEKENLHVVLFEDIKENPTLVVQSIFRFLEIEDFFTPSLKKKNETMGSARFVRANMLLYKWALQQPQWYSYLKGLIPLGIRFRIRRLMDKINTRKVMKSSPDPKTVAVLKSYYHEDIMNLEAFLNCDLSSWMK